MRRTLNTIEEHLKQWRRNREWKRVWRLTRRRRVHEECRQTKRQENLINLNAYRNQWKMIRTTNLQMKMLNVWKRTSKVKKRLTNRITNHNQFAITKLKYKKDDSLHKNQRRFVLASLIPTIICFE